MNDSQWIKRKSKIKKIYKAKVMRYEQNVLVNIENLGKTVDRAFEKAEKYPDKKMNLKEMSDNEIADIIYFFTLKSTKQKALSNWFKGEAYQLTSIAESTYKKSWEKEEEYLQLIEKKENPLIASFVYNLNFALINFQGVINLKRTAFSYNNYYNLHFNVLRDYNNQTDEFRQLVDSSEYQLSFIQEIFQYVDELIKNMDIFLDNVCLFYEYKYSLFREIIYIHKQFLNEFNEKVYKETREFDYRSDRNDKLGALHDEAMQLIKQRNNDFRSLLFLQGTRNFDEIYNHSYCEKEYLFINNLDDLKLSDLTVEHKEHISERSNNLHFNENYELLCKYLQVINTNDNIPSPCFNLNIERYRDLKIIYHEFITLGTEHIDKKNHKKSEININIKYQLEKIIDNYSNDHQSINKKNKYHLLDETNEKNILHFRQNILFTEKIRRGYYREFNLMDRYCIIFDLQYELRNSIERVIKIRDIETELSLLSALYADFYKIWKVYDERLSALSL